MSRCAVTALLSLALASPRASSARLVGPADAQRIVRAVARLAQAAPGENRFAVVAETATRKYVQFANAGRAVEFDFPIKAARVRDAPRRTRDQDCSGNPIRPRPGEVEERFLSPEEEGRLARLLERRKLRSSRVYCASVSAEGKRVGYTMSVAGALSRADEAPDLVEAVFAEVFRLDRVGAIEIETDE